MSYNKKFSKQRSKFYLQIFENDDNITLSANKFAKKLINNYQDIIEDLSPTGWKKSKNYDDIYSLWLPNDKIDYDIIDNFVKWAETCNNCIWVTLNKNIEEYFDEDILDFCICSDWNYTFDGKSGRTEIGEVEYRLKYVGQLSKDDGLLIEQYLTKCISCISNSLDDVLVTTIPAIKEKQNKASWLLAEFVADELETDFLKTTLLKDKPQMKSLDVSDKIKTWREIYATYPIETSIDSDELYGKTILIVDDLYQSGASMWCYAEYLKYLGASNVLGIALVKSLKDSDNKNHG
ncbi:MAG: hypothetical protein PHE51_08940 [Eubacteriales bacterium]|nr:hypothetical protein [Eubacteriales bacterium]